MQTFTPRRAAAALFAVLAVLPLAADPYVLFVANRLMVFLVLAVGLNILIGYAGQFAFSHAAIFGIGAYGTGLLQVKLGLPYIVAAAGGIFAATAIGTLVALPALRLSGLYLGLATLAFAMAVQWVFMNWNSVTFGAGGFRTPKLDVSPLPVGPDNAIYYLSWLVAVVLLIVAVRLVRSQHGRSFIAIRDGEIAAQSLGIHLVRTKVSAFAVSAAFAGTAGALYAPLLAFVSPESFDLFQMILVLSMVVVGGLGSITGTVLGVVSIMAFIELLRDAKAWQEILLGAILVNFALIRPDGLAHLLKRFPAWRERMSRPFDPHARAAAQVDHTAAVGPVEKAT